MDDLVHGRLRGYHHHEFLHHLDGCRLHGVVLRSLLDLADFQDLHHHRVLDLHLPRQKEDFLGFLHLLERLSSQFLFRSTKRQVHIYTHLHLEQHPIFVHAPTMEMSHVINQCSFQKGQQDSCGWLDFQFLLRICFVCIQETPI